MAETRDPMGEGLAPAGRSQAGHQPNVGQEALPHRAGRADPTGPGSHGTCSVGRGLIYVRPTYVSVC